MKQVGPRVFRIILTQGMNRQIRKMCHACGYKVVTLKRVRIMHIELGGLKLGHWRNLTPAEIKGLRGS
jgi:23S rRNA pseudouridine2604 synthase